MSDFLTGRTGAAQCSREETRRSPPSVRGWRECQTDRRGAAPPSTVSSSAHHRGPAAADAGSDHGSAHEASQRAEGGWLGSAQLNAAAVCLSVCRACTHLRILGLLGAECGHGERREGREGQLTAPALDHSITRLCWLAERKKNESGCPRGRHVGDIRTARRGQHTSTQRDAPDRPVRGKR